MKDKKKTKTKSKSKKQVGLLMSDGSPLTPEQKKKLERELKSGKVKVRKKSKPKTGDKK